MMNDKEGAIGCGQGKCVVAPSTLKAMLNFLQMPSECAAVAVEFLVLRALVRTVVWLSVWFLIPLLHGWVAWTIVAVVAIGVGVVCWIRRKIAPPYVIV